MQPSSRKYQIAIIGAGNVGYHLGKRFVECDLEVVQVYSRKITKARKLARQLGAAEPINDLGRLAQRINIIIIAVKDDVIPELALKISKHLPNALAVHTSGAMPCTILKPFFRKYGTFYPLQSFSIDRAVDFEMVPICIYSPQKRQREQLMSLAKIVAPNVYAVDDKEKSVLHVSAVFVNNFTNHLYHIGQQITENEGLNFDILKPLLLETALKVQQHDPKAMQTGPARRDDTLTINKHLEYLKINEYWATLYEKISAGIKKEF